MALKNSVTQTRRASNCSMRLLRELRAVHGHSGFSCRLAQLTRIDVVVPDDFVGAPTQPLQCNDLPELLDESTVADASLGRSVHGAHRIALQDASQRKPESQAAEEADVRQPPTAPRRQTIAEQGLPDAAACLFGAGAG
jgi:hypothetical protein